MKVFTLPALSVCIVFLFINSACISGQAGNSGGTNEMDNHTTLYNETAMPMVGNPWGEPENGTDMEEELGSPHLVVYNVFEQPCLLAVINATLRISYRVRPGVVEDTYIAISEIELPDHTEVVGECAEDMVRVMYDWDNSTFQVTFVFALQEEQVTEEGNTTTPWMLNDVQITFDLSNEEAFPGAKETNVVTVTRHDLGLFETPSDHTMVCEEEIKVQVGEDEPGVNLIFNYVELAAFGVTSEEFPEAVVHCEEGSFMRPDDDIVVPLIVACSLSLVVVLVVIAYAISRKIQEARDQTQYKPMP